MKRILVTGGAGFIGSHLCKALIAKGNKVICLDNLFSSTLYNIEPLLKDPNFKFLEHDVSSPVYLEVDEIYNLACPASPIHYQRDPVQTTKTSVMGALNLLDLAKKVGAKILQASTSEVYGDPVISPQSESYWGNVNPVGARSCYDEGKRCAETLFFDYLRQYNLNIKVARIFNTYGPHMATNDGRVVSNFVVQALKNEPVTIYGNGIQTRSFCFIDDMVTGLISLMAAKESFPGPINLGNPAEVTISDLASLIINLTKSRSKITNCPLPDDDPRQRKPNITLAREVLNWNPTVDITRGLQKTIYYFQNLLSDPLWESQSIRLGSHSYNKQYVSEEIIYH